VKIASLAVLVNFFAAFWREKPEKTRIYTAFGTQAFAKSADIYCGSEIQNLPPNQIPAPNPTEQPSPPPGGLFRFGFRKSPIAASIILCK
jgi:hypothetical protein